jgi:hypothetical protein
LFQLVTPLGDRIYTHAGDDGHLAIATMPKTLGFQPDIQPTLMFVQGAQKKVHLLVEHLGRVRLGLLTLGTLTLMHWPLFHSDRPFEDRNQSVIIPGAVLADLRAAVPCQAGKRPMNTPGGPRACLENRKLLFYKSLVCIAI